MTEPTRDEKNRDLAEFIGWNWWTRFGCRWFGPLEDWEDLGEPVRICTPEECDEETGVYISKQDCTKPPDFYTDPAASFLLLKKMPAGMVWHDGEQWHCYTNYKVADSMTSADDPLVAIAEAAWSLLQKEKTK